MPKPKMEFKGPIQEPEPHNAAIPPLFIPAQLKTLHPDQIELDPHCAVRRYSGPGADNKEIERIGLLADSFWEHGQAQPILVRPPVSETAQTGAKYRLIAGERRWRAAQRDGLELACYVRDVDDTQARALAFEENYRRKNFSPIDMALLFIGARDALGRPTPPDWSGKVAAQFGVSRATVTQHIKVYLHFAGDADTLTQIHTGKVRMNAALSMIERPQPTNGTGVGTGTSAVADFFNPLVRPDAISSWIWYDKQHHADLPLWQNCLYAVFSAGAKDIIGAAEKQYDILGGKRLEGLTRRQKAQARAEAESKTTTEAPRTMARAEAGKTNLAPADQGVPLSSGKSTGKATSVSHARSGIQLACECGWKTNWYAATWPANKELAAHITESSARPKAAKSKNR